MSVWGKIAGLAAGYAIGGVPGALIGAMAGHFTLDRVNDNQVVFTIALISLAAKMTRADGSVSPIEIKAVQDVLRVPDSEQRNMERVFQLAQEDVAGFDTYAKQVASIYAESPQVLEDVLDVLFFIAYADGQLHPAELQYLKIVADIFKVEKSTFDAVQARHDGRVQDPYIVLGVARHADDATVRAAWLKAVRDNHPDQLQARGMPQEMIHIATARMAAINDAWRIISKERGV
ncbi:TerB family tellurite resistance protein [Alphaproteobacteria bacterium]|nr:TerB family tellurite resistance protein [Alphaproteobacteria bacterium]